MAKEYSNVRPGTDAVASEVAVHASAGHASAGHAQVVVPARLADAEMAIHLLRVMPSRRSGRKVAGEEPDTVAVALSPTTTLDMSRGQWFEVAARGGGGSWESRRGTSFCHVVAC